MLLDRSADAAAVGVGRGLLLVDGIADRWGYDAFFATLYYAGLRPDGVVALCVSAAPLPAEGGGELLVHIAEPDVGSQWTDDGRVHETRHLKGRTEGDTRPVPAHPPLVAVLRDLSKRDGLQPDGLLFPGGMGGPPAGSVFHRGRDKARKTVLPTASHPLRSPSGPATAFPSCSPPTPAASRVGS
ncbi:hypothetical protein [Streptomyces viridochromogenes]|uniref:Putative mobile element protein n=1 Tax=Streptomyces viridochromogenes Tue57 TaxID=1160705 RepID=L8PR86_STRVR|nr:hypothetical protein [Streptomyces viridochromogenes]ELS58584.1 putative mobile element protein [Streptomyces viridochromogenes Tue57]